MNPLRHSRRVPVLLLCGALAVPVVATGTDADLLADFTARVAPVLDRHCYDCHGFGTSKGGLTLDAFDSGAALRADPGLWLRVLKKTRAGLMPPPDEPRPGAAEIAALGEWIKRDLFQLDPARPDPGRVTLRRLNQFEYRHTIRDLTAVEFDTAVEFPPDDTGDGFDVIGEALNISPMLLEKYLDAARQIVTEAVARDGFRAFAPADLPATPPSGTAASEDYARAVLADFAGRAHRRPVSASDVDRLATLARAASAGPDGIDDAGLAQALVAVLASPRFLFRQESAAPAAPGEPFPLLDEHDLAARLSYFLWSTTPDAPLLALARAGRLRAELPAQVERLLRDPRVNRFIESFVGQWLHARAVETAVINDFDVFLQEGGAPGITELRRKLRALQAIPSAQRTPAQQAEFDAAVKAVTETVERPRPRLTRQLRAAMRRETELTFAHLLAADRDVRELLDGDYTFLNEQLAGFYGIPGVTGAELRRVELPPGSVRGGLLTQGTFLVATSNPGRTSPVKRGIYILENILGAPPAPPPPEVPALEDAVAGGDITKATLRATLAAHREDPSCAACHDAMDPLGLAFEHFNALGREIPPARQAGIDVAGRLVTGETFAGVSELKRILATSRLRDFHYCLSEKLLTYALGRGLTHLDTLTVDTLVATLENEGGRLAPLVLAIIESAPFQRRRAVEPGAVLARIPNPPPP